MAREVATGGAVAGGGLPRTATSGLGDVPVVAASSVHVYVVVQDPGESDSPRNSGFMSASHDLPPSTQYAPGSPYGVPDRI